jgi:hypothetical protein
VKTYDAKVAAPLFLQRVCPNEPFTLSLSKSERLNDCFFIGSSSIRGESFDLLFVPRHSFDSPQDVRHEPTMVSLSNHQDRPAETWKCI